MKGSKTHTLALENRLLFWKEIYTLHPMISPLEKIKIGGGESIIRAKVMESKLMLGNKGSKIVEAM